jgi:hypothetical protein
MILLEIDVRTGIRPVMALRSSCKTGKEQESVIEGLELNAIV